MKRLIVLLVLIFTVPLHAGSEEISRIGFELDISEVLALGPLPIAEGALHEGDKAGELRRAAIMQLLSSGHPESGDALSIFGQTLLWETRAASVITEPGSWVWVLTLEARRFVEGDLHLTGLKSPTVWVDGVSREVKDGKVSLQLANGSHPFWLLHAGGVSDDSEDEGGERPALRWVGKSEHDRVEAHVQPDRRVSARILTNSETVNRLAVSPDGRRVALGFSARNDVANVDLYRLEIRDSESGRIEQSWTAGLPGALVWSPDGKFLAMQSWKHLWLHDTQTGASRLLLAEHDHLGAMRWHPDSKSIIFQWNHPFESKDDKVRRLRSLEDRWRNFRDNSQIFQVDIESGLVRPLTRADTTMYLLDIDRDGEHLLLSQRIIDYQEPPHALWALIELHIGTLEKREIGRYRLLRGAYFTDDGYWLLAGPGLAGGDGNTLGDDVLPNEYDGQLYLLSADGTTARSVSRDFDPAIGGIVVLRNKDLLVSVSEGDRKPVYHYSIARHQYTKIETPFDVIEDIAVSEDMTSPLLLLRGTSVARPQQVIALDLESGRSRTLVDTATGQYDNVKLGEVRDWSFENSSGDTIDGRYYLPPDFDPAHCYPLIVYYYGGTATVDRQFTGRYPFHLWAANGYVIYVLQPRGAPGYGQRYSSLHVNAWGNYAADDIIEGTRAFVDAHPFVDGDRIGNIGASYGGFMTMHLATRTDLFTASISHAGISSITSYWGQGWWGYGYSGIASRGSFPWNNRELYVERSPVYHADRITTPLLLLTGDSDTNVPPGESHNMFTALRLLGRTVEMIEVPNEDHWILDREKRYVWWDTILAWFDFWLKDEPQWWHALYPETKPKVD